MKIPMDIIIGDGEQKYVELDFYQGAKAIEGTSEVVAVLAHSILNGTVLKQVPSAEGIRANFKKSFVGSFGQKFELIISGGEQLKVFKQITEDGFFQIFSHYIGLVTGVRSPITKDAAIRWERTYIKDQHEVLSRIRGPLLKLHNPIEHHGYTVLLNKRKTNVSTLNLNTLEYISKEETDKNTTEIKAAITRFNKLTGTGRLLLNNEGDSVSFSPKRTWSSYGFSQKNAFSKNLHADNTSDTFESLTLEVHRVTGAKNIVKHYKVVRVVLPEQE